MMSKIKKKIKGKHYNAQNVLSKQGLSVPMVAAKMIWDSIKSQRNYIKRPWFGIELSVAKNEWLGIFSVAWTQAKSYCTCNHSLGFWMSEERKQKCNHRNCMELKSVVLTRLEWPHTHCLCWPNMLTYCRWSRDEE